MLYSPKILWFECHTQATAETRLQWLIHDEHRQTSYPELGRSSVET